MTEVPITTPQDLKDRPQEKKKRQNFFIELLKFTVIAVAIVVPIRVYVAQPFIVSGSSMVPTFENGEYLIVDELSYRFNNPERGEVIIFRYPKDTSKFFIKRIIGLPGERLLIENGSITVFSQQHPDGLPLNEPYLAQQSEDTSEIELADNEYFVLGDNRIASSDSRVWGPLMEDLIVGKAFLRLLPINKVAAHPGDFDAQQ